MSVVLPSIHDLLPLEQGGPIARRGFSYQDHVAAHFCITMLRTTTIEAVWCESQDDITVLHRARSGLLVEFVQVKAVNLDQLWSVAKLCERETSKRLPIVGTSILERSHQQDRAAEPARFRIITHLPPKSELELLQQECGPPREKAAGWTDLVDDVNNRMAGWKSSKGTGAEDWLRNAIWDCRGDEAAVIEHNRGELWRWVSDRGGIVFPDQLQALYQSLLTWVHDAGKAAWGVDGAAKKLLRAALEAKLDEVLAQLSAPHANNASPNLRRKMIDEAGLSDADYQQAVYFRSRFRRRALDPKLMQLRQRDDLEGAVNAELYALRSGLNAGAVLDNGAAFHNSCVGSVKALAEARGADASDALGCMFDITDRCLHRFRKVS